MNEFDQFVKHRLKQRFYIRYADDFVFLSENKSHVEKLVPEISQFLKEVLHLELHPKKVFIKTIASGVDFLGWVHFPEHAVIRTATKKRMMRTIRNIPNGDLENPVIRSYLGILSYGNGYKQKTTIIQAVS